MDNASFPSSDRSSTGTGTQPSTGSSSPSTGSGLGGSTYSSSGRSGGMGAGTHARETVDQAESTAHSTVDRVADTARSWAQKLDERTRGMSDMPMRAWDYSRSTVQEHPMQALLLSMLVGYVIGRFSGGRSTHYVEY